METTELIKRVRKIEIKTRGLTKHIFAGEYHSAFKGKGISFSEVREYQYGDDIRSIDWNVTARFNHPYVKVFEEERELTVMILVDISGSGQFGTKKQFKRDLITEVAAVLAYSAIQNNDKVGMIMFSDSVEKYIPPKKGRHHILRIIRELINYEAVSSKTNISEALKFLTNTLKKRSTCFVISDFMDHGFETALKIANRKHDVIALRTYDKRECELPSLGLMNLKDAETGISQWIDTSDKAVRDSYSNWWQEKTSQLDTVFKYSGVDSTTLSTDEDYIKPLLQLFKHR